jgi:hypothetical protein
MAQFFNKNVPQEIITKIRDTNNYMIHQYFQNFYI